MTQQPAFGDAQTRHHHLLHWLAQRGGHFSHVAVDWQRERPVLVATQDLAPGTLVVKAPWQAILPIQTARHSWIGGRLLGAGVSDDATLFAAYLAQARHAESHWRPLLDGFEQHFAHLPERFDRADWALLQGSRVQALARAQWQRLRQQFRRVNDLLPRAQRLRLRDFAWGWHVATSLAPAASRTRALLPITGLLAASTQPNCGIVNTDNGGVELRAEAAVSEGSALSVIPETRAATELMARFGQLVDDNPHGGAALSFEPGAVPRWLHAVAPELAGDPSGAVFPVDRDTESQAARRLRSFLRLSCLGSREAARAARQRSGNDANWIAPVDADNERAALHKLEQACAQALAGFAGSIEEDDRLLADGTLTARQRNAVSVRRNEKHVLLQYAALARAGLQPDALGCARDGSDDTQERAFIEWFREQGGQLGPAVLRRENGLRGMYAVRDLAPGEIVLRVPRHLFLTRDAASRSDTGMHLQGNVDTHTSLGVSLAEAKCRGSAWSGLLPGMPATLPTCPELLSREDFELLRGSLVHAEARRRWKRVRAQFKRTKALLPPQRRLPFRDFLWGYYTSMTRGFTLAIDGNETCGMVPMADMLNHVNDYNCVWGGRGADHTRFFEVRVRRHVSKGGELTVGYGSLPDTKLLSQYGFCLGDNVFDVTALRFTLERSHWLHDFVPEHTCRQETQECTIGLRPEMGNVAFSLLRLSVLPGANAVRCDPRIDRRRLNDVPMLDEANEQAVLRRLVQACGQRLAEFPGSADEDDQLLAGGTLTAVQRMLVTVRRSEKRLLLHTAGNARRALEALEKAADERHATLQQLAAQQGPWQPYFQRLTALCGSGGPAAAAQRAAAHSLVA